MTQAPKRKKVLSIASVIRKLEGLTDKIEAIVAEVRTLAYHLDRHRARALKRKRRRRSR